MLLSFTDSMTSLVRIRCLHELFQQTLTRIVAAPRCRVENRRNRRHPHLGQATPLGFGFCSATAIRCFGWEWNYSTPSNVNTYTPVWLGMNRGTSPFSAAKRSQAGLTDVWQFTTSSTRIHFGLAVSASCKSR